ncbi:hypothetical protein SDC9_144350 [bioreactor metagenome]|uniref:Uncharacterized protein n=1 Tax=bioreactor metagenome TaxID=1076179 RepID=A0A645E5Z3_9ZZZZ
MRDKDNSDAPCLEIAHQRKQLADLALVQGRCRLIQNEHLAFHIHGAGYGNHLLHGQRAGRKLLRRPRRYSQFL